MQMVSLTSVIPVKQCWWVFKEPACLSTELLFCSNLEGYRITHGDRCLRHSRQALARSNRWVRTRAIGRRTHWVHLALYLGTSLTLFRHQCLGTLRNTGPFLKGSGDCVESSVLSHSEGTLDSSSETTYKGTLLSVLGGPRRLWQWGPWCVVERT